MNDELSIIADLCLSNHGKLKKSAMIKQGATKNIYQIVKEKLARPKEQLGPTQLLGRLARAGGLSSPHYEYECRGSPSQPKHHYTVRFCVPESIRKGSALENSVTITGRGQFGTKAIAKEWAAGQVIERIERGLRLKPHSLQAYLEEYEKQQNEKKEAMKAIPVEREIPGVSWENLPIDLTFKETEPASRRGYLEFFPDLVKNQKAFAAAKALTLTAKQHLPTVVMNANPSESGKRQEVSSFVVCFLFLWQKAFLLFANNTFSPIISHLSGPILFLLAE
jgi:hypothetical protein